VPPRAANKPAASTAPKAGKVTFAPETKAGDYVASTAPKAEKTASTALKVEKAAPVPKSKTGEQVEKDLAASKLLREEKPVAAAAEKAEE